MKRNKEGKVEGKRFDQNVAKWLSRNAVCWGSVFGK
jgi:hypothetical protein